MSKISRRAFVGAAGVLPALAFSEQEGAKPDPSFRRRTHPLEGIAREKLKISDVKVTLLSYAPSRNGSTATLTTLSSPTATSPA